jgi:MSHA biogenesis protein MshM
VAGYDGARLFSRGAVARLYGASGGVPRLVNILAHKAMMLCYGQGRQQVARAHVLAAARDTLATSRRRPSWGVLAGVLAALLALAAGVAWALSH